MRQFQRLRKPAPWIGAVLVLAASLALVACDNDVNFTGPDPPVVDAVWVSATLNSEEGGCTGARLLYDGKHIGVNYDACGADGRSCGELTVTGFTDETAGRHTIEVLVLGQTSAEVTYQVAAEVRDRPGGPAQFRLGPVSRTLREGESVTFEVDIP